MTDDDLSDLAWAAEDDGDEDDLAAWADAITDALTDHLTTEPKGPTMPTTTVQIDANPSPAAILAARTVLARNGINPDNQDQVMHLATYGVSPLSVVTACAQLAVTFDCAARCGNKLDPGDKDAMGLGLCRPCVDAAEMENAHSDGHHEGPDADPDCPDCQERGL